MSIFSDLLKQYPPGLAARVLQSALSSPTRTIESSPPDTTEHQQGRPTALTTGASSKTTTVSGSSMLKLTQSPRPMGYEEDTYISTLIQQRSTVPAENVVKSLLPPELNSSQDGSKTVLQEANDAVFGPRQHYYGHPRDNFKRISDLWSTIVGTTITPEQTGLMMIALKVSRLMETPGHRDSYVDIAGYAEATARAVGLDA